MRGVFFNELIKMMETDESLFFLTGDTGFNLVEPIFDVAPDRALNVGVAEQNMIGIASGLINAGFVPVCYAITNFLVHRCFEQIRNDLCLHEYKAILVGTSTGYDNGALGATHHKLDDIGSIKALPNIRIYSPSGSKSMSAILNESLTAKHSSFIRIPKGGIAEELETNNPNHFICESDSPVLVISHGKMVSNALTAHRIEPAFSLFAMDRIKPLDNDLIKELFEQYEIIIVLEDNFSSGLFNSLCQWAVENNSLKKRLCSITPAEKYDSIMGDSAYLEDKHGLSPVKILERVRQETKLLN
jgi:transketolase